MATATQAPTGSAAEGHIDPAAKVASAAPIQTRSERPTSFDPADFAVPTGREVNWKLTPIDRLAALFAIVVATTALVTGLVAAAIAGGTFHRHLDEAGVADPSLLAHVEQAFRDSLVPALAIAAGVALVVGIALALVLSRRISTSLRDARDALRRIASGERGVEVPDPRLGAEFDDLRGALERVSADLDHVDETRTQMLGDLAHEMRTPLGTFQAYVEALEDGVAEANPETIRVLREQVERLSRLAEDVTLVTTAEEGRLSLRLEVTTVGTLVRGARDQALPRFAAHGVALEADASSLGVDAAVRVDPQRMSQVFGNLLDNALAHTPRGGHVTISATTAGAVARLRVRDDGEGIPDEHLPHIFERFYRVDPARDRRDGGSGVGLAIVKAIVEDHGGSVHATSAGPGRGTEPTIDLPLARGGAVRPRH